MTVTGVEYEGMSNRIIYDKIRKYCIAEGVDEDYFRASIRHKKQGRENASIKTRKDSKYVGKSRNPTKKRGIRTVTLVIAAMIFILGGITIFLYIPYSNANAESISLTEGITRMRQWNHKTPYGETRS